MPTAGDALVGVFVPLVDASVACAAFVAVEVVVEIEFDRECAVVDAGVANPDFCGLVIRAATVVTGPDEAALPVGDVAAAAAAAGAFLGFDNDDDGVGAGAGAAVTSVDNVVAVVVVVVVVVVVAEDVAETAEEIEDVEGDEYFVTDSVVGVFAEFIAGGQ